MFDNTKFTSTTVDGVVTLSYEDEKSFTAGDESISQKDLKAASEYTAKYVEEATKLAATEAQAIMEKDSGTNKVLINFPFSTSKRGNLGIAVDRSKTYPGIQDRPDVTKSTIRVTATDPVMRMSKSKIKDLEKDLTAALLG